ncbi:MAG: redoxin domain-containing protein [Acidobacteriota bacterium]|nr:redoxin domain-containing protein [Acidobacteriota bacterium]
MLLLSLVCVGSIAASQTLHVFDLSHHPVDPFAAIGQIRVMLFVRTDCPISQRYAPELQRIAQEFAHEPVQFWLVFPDSSETSQKIRAAIHDYNFPGTPVLDPEHLLVKLAQATVAPEAAVFDKQGKLVYHGRIDDRYVDIGKARPEAQIHDLESAIAALLAGKPIRRPETRAVGCSLAEVE